jgi:chemotaxis protein CheD
MTSCPDDAVSVLPPPRRAGVRMAPLSQDAQGIVHTLHPGDVAVGGAGERMTTLLGSCVAIVLTDPRRTVGAMCHIVHAPSAVPPPGSTGAFADVAFGAMFDLLALRGITPRLCQAFVFGGGNMFPGLDIAPGTAVGDDNARWALDALESEGIRVLCRDLGGHVYRRLSWTVGRAAPRVVAVPI